MRHRKAPSNQDCSQVDKQKHLGWYTLWHASNCWQTSFHSFSIAEHCAPLSRFDMLSFPPGRAHDEICFANSRSNCTWGKLSGSEAADTHLGQVAGLHGANIPVMQFKGDLKLSLALITSILSLFLDSGHSQMNTSMQYPSPQGNNGVVTWDKYELQLHFRVNIFIFFTVLGNQR